MKVLFVAPECTPLTKTGGLGDVCAALPPALRAHGIDVRMLIPGYTAVLRGIAAQPIADGNLYGMPFAILEAAVRDVPAYILDCPPLYAREGGPYLAPDGRDWPDNALRFGALSRAAAILSSAASPLDWRPQVLHCNDWPSALAPAFARYASGGDAAPSLVTIHNLAFQGNFEAGTTERLGLPWQAFTPDGVEFYGQLSFLKGGLASADALNTVSPTYAREIQTPEYGCGLDGLLRHRAGVLAGILNGIDTAAWDPAQDPHIARQYDAATLERKPANKAALQRALGLAAELETPLIGLVGRMTHQKGIDLVLAAGDAIAAQAQMAFLGSGEPQYEQGVRELAGRHPGRVAARIGFDEGLAHLIEAGADLFLMPSRYEPCGLNQMYSQRYGTPPVVRRTGGLADTVEDGVTGFVFEALEPGALAAAVARALETWRRPGAWRAMQRAGMGRDFSWSAAARRYADLYRRLARPGS